MNEEMTVMNDAIHYRAARRWDRMVTLTIIVLLFIPLPFVCFESWPGGTVLLERPIMPWSRFHFCYISFPNGEPVEEIHRFTWDGKIALRNAPLPLLLDAPSLNAPSLKWQNSPEVILKDVHLQGEFVQVTTRWQPPVFWPLRMIWRASGRG